ncbi:MAG: ABC-F family ATP-binding cassette domain-containing protein [Bacteroidales bacterium]|nr:ABC-F family ATP-binding cassette domain-containing protein [Bacteroidales bacterium]MCF0200611.1 ABC-F family ATP-binding cassette domain-containing protein [Bacteroidales bacterium]MCF0201077.1 ABC-F family ATP-binding cassette domain-containing protein [Bacteroidales bacterium]MCF0201693.1 ABC-F family ATP-binding cassette domain-containing protein [Bacteroidales bacterium]
MISIQNLSMHFTGDDLFADISFLIREKDRIGLVGKNGAGKTTLLKLICGLEQPSKGDVIIPQGVSIGYLPQEKNVNSEKTVLEEALSAFDEYHQLERDAERLQQQLAERTDYESAQYQKLIEKLTNLNDRIALLGGSSIEGEAERILVGLGFDHDDMPRPMREFSNGWQMRVELAKILLKKPNLLLLDEPTNHLDIESIQWLEGFLKSYYGAILMVSHDRAFLDNITIRTVEISNGKIYDYKVPYSDYVGLREERVDMQRSAYENQQREIKNIEAFIERFRYKATKAKQVQSRVKQLERMEEIEIDDIDATAIHFKFPPAPHSGKVSLELNHVGKAYGNSQILKDVNLLIPRGEKIAFVGRNGEGKSTLSKIIVGVLDHEGEVKLGHEVKIGYYAQNQQDMLDMNKTVFETLDDVAVGEMRLKVKALLGAFLFRGDDIDKKVKVLSGGEKARLSLAKMLLFPTNLLVLDEPTNHLDMLSKDILKNALIQFDGTLIIVSHDRDFLQGLTNKVYEFRKPNIKEYVGDIYDFLQEKNLSHLKELERAKQQVKVVEQVPQSQNKINYERKKQFDARFRKIDKEIQRLEEAIGKMETELAALDAVMASPDSHPEVKVDNDFYWSYGKKKEAMQALMDEWGEKQIEREEVEAEYKSGE